MFRVLFFIVCFMPAVLINGESPEDNFIQANKLYFAKEYRQAIEMYSDIINSGYENAEVYYNLGNAYYRVGRLGYSILYYEKALRLSPKDEDIKHNLALANLRTVDRIETLPEFFLFNWWEGLLKFFSLQELTFVGLVLYLLLLVSAAFYFFTGSAGRQKKWFFSAIISVMLISAIIGLFIVKYNREINESEGIVITNSSYVKVSPDESSENAFLVHEGLKVKIEDKVNNWLKIMLIDGKIGWIKTEDIEVI